MYELRYQPFVYLYLINVNKKEKLSNPVVFNLGTIELRNKLSV